MLGTLREAAVRVAVPDVVVDELRAAGPDDPTVRALDDARWLEIIPTPPIPESVTAWKLDPGETAVLSLGLFQSGCEVVLDDYAGHRCADAHGLPCRGTLGVILFAKEIGLIPAARPVLEELRRSGMYLSDRVLDRALARVGESLPGS